MSLLHWNYVALSVCCYPVSQLLNESVALCVCCAISLLHYQHVELWVCCTMSLLPCESVALVVCCTINLMHCESVALWACCTVSMLNYQSVALWVCCTMNLLHYQSVALWPGHRAVTRWAQHIWAFASQPSTWSGRCAIKRGVSIHRGTRHSTVFKYCSHSGATRARLYLLGWFCY